MEGGNERAQHITVGMLFLWFFGVRPIRCTRTIKRLEQRITQVIQYHFRDQYGRIIETHVPNHGHSHEYHVFHNLSLHMHLPGLASKWSARRRYRKHNSFTRSLVPMYLLHYRVVAMRRLQGGSAKILYLGGKPVLGSKPRFPGQKARFRVKKPVSGQKTSF